ncbi:MAG UNVERIFIED_CONTAM: DUF2155 domain-containing protein [Rickettsiaceae bacterium]|jgi:hypothetical protein
MLTLLNNCFPSIHLALINGIILSIILYSTTSFASQDNKKLWDEGDVFESKTIEEDQNYDAFDILQEKDRYKNEAQNIFDVTEGNVQPDEQSTTNVEQPIEKTSLEEVAPPITEGKYFPVARLVAINKVTGRSKNLEIKTGESKYFGNMEIAVKKCWYNGDLYRPSYKVLVNVVEQQPEIDAKLLFDGWMISSNIPSCTMQNPTYEIILIGCYDKSSKNPQ